MRSYYALKNKYNLQRIIEKIRLESRVSQLFDNENSLSQKLSKGNNDQSDCHHNQLKEVNIMKNFECQQLQTSKYIIIQNDMHRIEAQYKFLKKHKMEDTIDGFTDSIDCFRGKLNLAYCPEDEILKKRIDFLKFKAGFLSKMRLLQQNGRMIQVNNKLDCWMEDNMD